MTEISFVVLTQGNRDRALRRALASIRQQVDCEPEIVVVANGTQPPRELDADRVVTVPGNAGIPGGRNIGVGASTGDVIFFLDDDAKLADKYVCRRVLDLFDQDPLVGAVSLRILDPKTGRTQRRHVPRIGKTDPGRSSAVTTFLGGASAVRASVIRDLGGFSAEFVYAHEEIDLAWRLIESGFQILYRGDLNVHHPETSPSRHPEYHFLSMRNRVLLARRNLPIPLMFLYPLVWLIISVLRTRTPATYRRMWAGMTEGWRLPVNRSPISWATVWRLTVLGRPPVI